MRLLIDDVFTRASQPFWKAGLSAFVGAALLYLVLPLPEAMSVREQVLILGSLQAAAIILALLIVRIRRLRRGLEFDLGARRPRRRLTPEQFLD
jgi:hypothetical protein